MVAFKYLTRSPDGSLVASTSILHFSISHGIPTYPLYYRCLLPHPSHLLSISCHHATIASLSTTLDLIPQHSTKIISLQPLLSQLISRISKVDNPNWNDESHSRLLSTTCRCHTLDSSTQRGCSCVCDITTAVSIFNNPSLAECCVWIMLIVIPST